MIKSSLFEVVCVWSFYLSCTKRTSVLASDTRHAACSNKAVSNIAPVDSFLLENGLTDPEWMNTGAAVAESERLITRFGPVLAIKPACTESSHDTDLKIIKTPKETLAIVVHYIEMVEGTFLSS